MGVSKKCFHCRLSAVVEIGYYEGSLKVGNVCANHW